MRTYIAEIKQFVSDASKTFICLLLAVFICPNIFSQFPGAPSVPQPHSFSNQNNFNRVNPSLPSPQPNITQPGINVQNNSIQEQNARIMLEVHQHQQQQMMNQQTIEELLELFTPNRINSDACMTAVRMPDYSSLPGTNFFYNAFNEINKMLTGETELSIKDAVFMIEKLLQIC